MDAVKFRAFSNFFIQAPIRIKIFILLTFIYTGTLCGYVLYGTAFETKTILYLVTGLGAIFSLLFWLNILGCFLCIRYVRKLFCHGDDIDKASFYINAAFILGYCAIVIWVSYFLLNINWWDL